MEETIAAVLGAFIGVAGALFASALLARRTERAAATSAAIAEFFSDSFLQHRISLHSTRQKVKRGEVTVADVAAGFWYPGLGIAYFEGDILGSLNEHQHIEAYLGFVSRLDFLVRRGWASPVDLERALGA